MEKKYKCRVCGNEVKEVFVVGELGPKIETRHLYVCITEHCMLKKVARTVEQVDVLHNI